MYWVFFNFVCKTLFSCVFLGSNILCNPSYFFCEILPASTSALSRTCMQLFLITGRPVCSAARLAAFHVCQWSFAVVARCVCVAWENGGVACWMYVHKTQCRKPDALGTLVAPAVCWYWCKKQPFGLCGLLRLVEVTYSFPRQPSPGQAQSSARYWPVYCGFLFKVKVLLQNTGADLFKLLMKVKLQMFGSVKLVWQLAVMMFMGMAVVWRKT